MIIKSTKLAALAAATLLSLPSLAATPVIVNAGFEQQTAPFGGQSLPTGWTLLVPTGWSYDTFGGGASPAGGKHWGVQYLTGWGIDSAVGIEQTITGLSVGATYEISFWDLASHDMGQARWNVTFGNETKSGKTLTAALPWTSESVSFVATASSQVLRFASEFIGATPHATPTVLTLDGITIKETVAAPVPEPSSLALLLAGTTALGFVVSRRRNSKKQG